MKQNVKRQIDEIEKSGKKKVKVEEEMVYLDYLVLEQSVSLMKKKFTNDLSLESVSKLFTSILLSNRRKLKVKMSVESKCEISVERNSYELNLSDQRWEGDLLMKNMTESQLKSIFKEIFIRFKHFHCVSFDLGSDILSQVISENQYRPIKVKQLKLVPIDQNICSLIKNLSTIVKEMHIDGENWKNVEDICIAISTCINLRSLVLSCNCQVDITTPLQECVKLLKYLKHFQFSLNDQSYGDKHMIDSKWLVSAFEGNKNLRSLSLPVSDQDGHFDLATLCVPSMRSIMSR
jgi:hypothetical protein